MNQLTVIENKALTALPVAYQQLVAVRFKKPIREYENYDLEREIKNLIMISFAEMGHTTSAQDNGVITFLRETLLRDFRKPKFATLTMEAIRLFVSNGIRGDYGTFNNQLNAINIQNIHYWIRKGQESHEWKTSLEEFNKIFLDQNTSEVPLQVKINRSIEGIISAFEYYQKEGRIQFCGFAYYDILNELIGEDYKGRKTLITDPVTRRRVFEESEVKYKRELAVKKSKARFQGREDIVKGVDLILENLRDQKGLENRQKELLLAAYFDKLIKEGTDIRTVLKKVA